MEACDDKGAHNFAFRGSSREELDTIGKSPKRQLRVKNRKCIPDENSLALSTPEYHKQNLEVFHRHWVVFLGGLSF